VEPLIDDKEIHEPESADEEYNLRDELTEEVNHISEVHWVGTLHNDPEKHMSYTNYNRKLIINYIDYLHLIRINKCQRVFRNCPHRIDAEWVDATILPLPTLPFQSKARPEQI
jgi:hypothetical protein